MIKSIKIFFRLYWINIFLFVCGGLSTLPIDSNWCKLIIIFVAIIVAIPIHHFFIEKPRKKYITNDNQTFMVTRLNIIRKLAYNHNNLTDDNDKTAICVSICNEIYNTVSLKEINESKYYGSMEYCVVISLLQSNNISFKPIYCSNENPIFDSFYNSDTFKISMRLSENSLYNKIINEYNKNHNPIIITKSNIKGDSTIRSSLRNVKGLEYSKIPHNSVCIFPILPFHNVRNGTELRGFVSIYAKNNDAFKESTNKEFESYLESVSSYIHKILK